MKGHFEKGAWVEEKPIPDEDFDDRKIELFINNINRKQHDYEGEMGGRPDLLIIHPHDAQFLGAVERYLWSRHYQNAPMGFGIRTLLGMAIQFSETLVRKDVMLMAGNETIKHMIIKTIGKTNSPLIHIHGVVLELNIKKMIIEEAVRRSKK